MFILKRRRWSNLKAGRCTLTQLNCWEGLRLAQHSDWDDDLMVNKYHSVWRRSHLQKNAPPVWQVVLRKCSVSIYRVEQRPDKKLKKKHPHTWQNLNAKGSVRIFVWLRSEVARTPPPQPCSSLPSLGASAHWPLPLVVHHQPTCSSDSQCYGQTASQWKMPEHFLGFTNTV